MTREEAAKVCRLLTDTVELGDEEATREALRDFVRDFPEWRDEAKRAFADSYPEARDAWDEEPRQEKVRNGE